MKNGAKKVEKDDWRAVSGPEKCFDKQWRGRTVFKIKAGVALPAEELPHVKSSSKPGRISDPSDEVKPERSSPEEVSGKSKSSSAPAEEGKSGSSSDGLKRRLGRKTTSPSVVQDDFGKEFIGELEKELDMELDKSEKVRRHRPKGDDGDYTPSSDDERWEKAKKKPGNESLEPRWISVPLPGSEAQALTPAYRKMIKRLDDKVELYKLHVKHYHMSPTQFRRRTSMLNLPDRIYEKYEEVYNTCRVCSMSVAPPLRAKISGIRASVFGDVVFVDHCEIELKKKKYAVLLVLDGATNLLWATAQNSLESKETLTHLRSWNEQNNCIPKTIVGDEAFFSDEFNEYYKFHGIKPLPCGPRTPWPNRAETAVRLFKKQWTLMATSLEGDDRLNGVTIRQAVKMTVWARNTQLTISGYSPLEIATGRRPPDLFVETANPEQLTSEPPEEDISTLALQRLALRAHQEARQAADLRHDMARRTMPSDEPYKHGDEIFSWHQDSSKFKDKGRWIRGKVLSQEGAMVHIHTDKAVIRINQSKVRRDHDEWHDVSIPNLDESKEEIKEDGDLKREDHNLLCEGCFGEQAFWFYDDQKCDVLELFGSSSGYSWMMARKCIKVGQPIDHKHGSNLNTAYGQAEAWKKIMKMHPEIIFINNPSPQSARKMIFRFCFEVIMWQCKRNKKFLVTCPEGSYFSQFLDQKKWRKIMSNHLCWERIDLHHFCNCEDKIRNMIVYHAYDEYYHDVPLFGSFVKKKFFEHEACWNDPHWKHLPARFVAGLIRAIPEVSRSFVTDERQEFLLEDILEDFDNGLLCGTFMHHDRHDEHSLLLRDLDMRNDDIPVPLRHILPQKFSTPSLVSTLRMIDALRIGTEVSVRESTNEKIAELIPGLQNIRRMTLPQMYFESCSFFCGTFGRVNPLFSLPDDSVILGWNPGSYHRIFFMFMSQLYPH